MVTVLIAALLASASPAPPAAVPEPVQARPAMWVVRDHDTTIYLFGTFHALDGRSNWFNNEVREAFASSDQLILETIIPDRPRLIRHDPPARSMHSFSVAPGASFLAGTRMAVSAGRDQGMQASKGADMVLRRAAEAEGKPVAGLESLQFQIGMFNRMAPAQPRTGVPAGSAAAKAQLTTLMAHMQSAWNRGDQRIFAALLDDMRHSSPDGYRVMFPERNAHWAGWIANRMTRPGTVFVAVGAGHFAGPDSVQSQLTLKGLVATRVS